MIKILKANKSQTATKAKFKYCHKLIIAVLLVVCIIFISNPALYSKSCLNAISVWSFKVLPVLLPFFIFTKIIVAMIEPRQTKLDKLFFKVYNTPQTSSTIFLLSAISGYPMGAKLICDMFDRGIYTQQDAKRMLAFCSISGPMFMIGTVGVAIFNSYKAGVIILLSNLIASLINGLIYRGKRPDLNKQEVVLKPNEQTNILSDCVYDSLISILMVGGFMILAFLLIDVLKNTHILSFLSLPISKLIGVDNNLVQSVITGGFEITRGIIDLNNCSIALKFKVMFASGLIGFGGISIMMQSISFLNKLKIKSSYVFLQKLTQGLLAFVISIPLSLSLI